MNITQINNLTVYGVTTRTCNANEISPATARIGPLWESFGRQVFPHMAKGSLVYGVYHDYESDAAGEFNVLAGVNALIPSKDKTEVFSSVEILAGSYLVFDARGAMPQAVIEAWGRIWNYFADPQCQHKRAYTTDFECYRSENLTEIFIALA